ncbi:MAG: zinc transport system substrate-binding protein [Euryarchaeota archaeon]|nr:zinc transport system substrate-binding protein [Euryarchaeota archaeon]
MGSHDNKNTVSFSLVAAVFTAVLLAAAAAGCTGAERQDGEKVVVAVTIPPEVEFVERVGGDHVRVILLVPPGADPHTYEPPPGTLADVAEADMYAVVGSGIEFELAWREKIAALNPGMLVVDSSRGVELIAAGDGEGAGADPHIWTSPKNAKTMVENIRDGLIAVDPANAETYRQNADAYLGELDALDAEITGALAASGVKKVMVYHSSWAYLARDYGFVEVPIESEGKEPSPQRLERLIKQAEEENIRVVFASPEHSTRNAEVIADAIGSTVVTVSPLAKDYLANMRHVASAFAESGRP